MQFMDDKKFSCSLALNQATITREGSLGACDSSLLQLHFNYVDGTIMSQCIASITPYQRQHGSLFRENYKSDHILSLHSMILNSSGRWLILLKVNPRSFSRPSFKLQIKPCILNSCPIRHASCTIGILATLYTCCFTLSSLSKFSFSSGVSAFRSLRYLALMSLICDSQASSGPWSCFLKAALIPPQPQCPAMMISFTLSTCTEYWTTARTLMSEGGAWLAMFRCTKSSPGCRPTIQLAGIRESEQPIQRYSGDWTVDSLQKYSGSSSIFSQDQMRLLRMMTWKLSIMVDSERKKGTLGEEVRCLRRLAGDQLGSLPSLPSMGEKGILQIQIISYLA